MHKIESETEKLSDKEIKFNKLNDYYSKKLDALVHEHFQKITSDTTQEEIEIILKEGNKKWLEICAMSRATDKKIITLNINAFTDFLKDSMNNNMQGIKQKIEQDILDGKISAYTPITVI